MIQEAIKFSEDSMNIAYFDCFSGASGDMILGALIDAGLSLEQLKNELAKLHLTHYDLQVKKVLKKGIGGSQVVISVDDDHHHHHHRNLHHIEEIVVQSDLDKSIKEKGLKIFRRLAEAEAKIATEMKIKFQNAIKSVSKVKSAKELEKLKIDTTGWSAKDKALLKNAIEEKKTGLENESKKE